MFWNSKKNLIEKLKRAWGKPKEEDFKFESIEHYFRKTDKSAALQVIANQTINDLDFFSLFTFTDRTSSKIGQQYLFSKLLTIVTSPDFDEQEAIIEHISKNERDRIEAQIILSKLSDDKAFFISWLFLEEFIKPPHYLSVMKWLSVITFLTVAAAFFMHTIVFLAICLVVTNMVLHYVNKKHIYLYSDSIPQLSLLCKNIKELLNLRLPVQTADLVRSSVRSIDKIKRRMSVFTLESKQETDIFMSLGYFLIEYVKIIFLLEPIMVFGVLKHLRERRTDIQNLFEYFGKIDAAISIASLRQGLSYCCKPTIRRDCEGLSFTDLYHPLIPNCIPNTMTVKEKSILLTGSNMSGKSTFIRSVSINTIFAQTINTCFASSFHLSPMKIFSAIRISDDVLSGKSYYFEEVLTIKEMIQESRRGIKTMFLLDEIFKGTNTIERIAAGKAVLSYICKNRNIVFVSTHDIELAGLLKNTYELFHFTEMVENNQVHFDYKLKSGELKTRNAIRILEINGYPKEVIEEAQKISNQIIGYSKTLE